MARVMTFDEFRGASGAEAVITIEADENRSQFVFADGQKLFQFEWRDSETGGPGWYFWLRGGNNPDRFMQEEFPVEFFKQAVLSTVFIKKGKKYSGVKDFDDLIETIEK